MSLAEIHVHDDAADVARAAAESFVAASQTRIREGGRFTVVLAGGATPLGLYRLLASEPWRSRVPWSRTVALFGDERHVGPDDERSNYRAACEALLDHVPIPGAHVHRMRGEAADSDEAAEAYEILLQGLYPSSRWPRFDLVLLGVGRDGHTASLFPGTAAVTEPNRWVVSNAVPALDTWRLTLTLPALCAAREVLFLAVGESKARVVAEAFGDELAETAHPCARVLPTRGRRSVLIDREAASLLTRP
jgi:6-phosphogluconolactonase